MGISKRTCRNQFVRALLDTEPERISVPREVEDLKCKGVQSIIGIATNVWSDRVRTPVSPLYAPNFCERRPSGTRLSAISGARQNRSAVRALSLRLSDDLSGATGNDGEMRINASL